MVVFCYNLEKTVKFGPIFEVWFKNYPSYANAKALKLKLVLVTYYKTSLKQNL